MTMECERCNKKRVTVCYRESINGRTRALRLCDECFKRLEQAGELTDMSIPLWGLQAPLLGESEGSPRPLAPVTGLSEGDGGRVCAGCGLRLSEAVLNGSLGCSACYTEFAKELEKPLQWLHGRVEHRGRLSSGHRARLQIQQRCKELKVKLKAAIAGEDFEQAAALRDEIRGLEATL